MSWFAHLLTQSMSIISRLCAALVVAAFSIIHAEAWPWFAKSVVTVVAKLTVIETVTFSLFALSYEVTTNIFQRQLLICSCHLGKKNSEISVV